MANLKAAEYKSFEDIKHTDERGNEFWNARELSEILMYSKWENFSKVIQKAMLACKNSGSILMTIFLRSGKWSQ